MRMHAQACVCWSKYTTSEKLNSRLSLVDWTNSAETVQQVWNDFEIKLINVVDLLAPLTEFKDDKPTRKLDPSVKRKLNIRNRLLKQLKMRPTLDLKSRIKNLNDEIRGHFYSEKKK